MLCLLQEGDALRSGGLAPGTVKTDPVDYSQTTSVQGRSGFRERPRPLPHSLCKRRREVTFPLPWAEGRGAHNG